MLLLLACSSLCANTCTLKTNTELHCILGSVCTAGIFSCHSEIKKADFIYSNIGNIKTLTIEFDYDITKMDDECFTGLINLETFFFQNNNNKGFLISPGAFKGLSKLKTLSLGSDNSKLTSIGNSSFEGCKSLNFFPFQVKHIPNRTFFGCESFIKFTGNFTAGNYAFANCIGLEFLELRGNDYTYGEGLCENCTSLKTANIVNKNNGTPPSLGKRSFYGCYSLTETSIDVSSVGDSSYENCISLINVKLTFDTNINENAFKNCSSLPEIKILSNANFIGNFAFQDCTSLASAEIPNVNLFGTNVFERCFNLENISFGSTFYNGYMFSQCKKLANVKLSKKAFFDNSVFSGCESLKNFSMDATNIGSNVFKGCISLYNVSLRGFETFGNKVFADCISLSYVVIQANETNQCTIGSNIFFNCTSIKSVAISSFEISQSNSLSSSMIQSADIFLNNYGVFQLFKGCNYIEYVRLNVKELDPHSFDGCISLKTLNISKTSIKAFPAYCFNDCASLTEVHMNIYEIPISEIGEYAFNNCKSLKEFTIPLTVTTIGDYAFFGSSIGTIKIPRLTAKLGVHSFKGNKNMTTITINKDNIQYVAINNVLYNKSNMDVIFYPEGNTITPPIDLETLSIAPFAFSNCSFESIEIGQKITKIGEKAFSFSNLKYVTIGSGVTTIGQFAFANCQQLRTAKFCQSAFFVSIKRDDQDSTVFQNCPPSMEIFVNKRFTDDTIYGRKVKKIVYDDCQTPTPTPMFSDSFLFSRSSKFMRSSDFTSSAEFMRTRAFSHSNHFEESSQFEETDQFVSSIDFSYSNSFESFVQATSRHQTTSEQADVQTTFTENVPTLAIKSSELNVKPFSSIKDIQSSQQQLSNATKINEHQTFTKHIFESLTVAPSSPNVAIYHKEQSSFPKETIETKEQTKSPLSTPSSSDPTKTAIILIVAPNNQTQSPSLLITKEEISSQMIEKNKKPIHATDTSQLKDISTDQTSEAAAKEFLAEGSKKGSVVNLPTIIGIAVGAFVVIIIVIIIIIFVVKKKNERDTSEFERVNEFDETETESCDSSSMMTAINNINITQYLTVGGKDDENNDFLEMIFS